MLIFATEEASTQGSTEHRAIAAFQKVRLGSATSMSVFDRSCVGAGLEDTEGHIRASQDARRHRRNGAFVVACNRSHRGVEGRCKGGTLVPFEGMTLVNEIECSPSGKCCR